MVRAERSTHNHADVSRVPAVVLAEGSVGTDHSHGDEGDSGPNRQPGRPSL